MNLKYATVFGLAGMVIAIGMGLFALVNDFIRTQENPAAGMDGAYKTLLAAVIAVVSWVAPVKFGRFIGGLALGVAGVCTVALVTPPIAALFLALAGVLLLTARDGVV